ncbi:MAG: carbohydrate kinase family protein [Aliihoeflea sp.]|uniref:carbohydrate kinase family protein n=1 Tax=Aliihoeflea sp. TaxID=2608088 RepID=UPI004034CE82
MIGRCSILAVGGAHIDRRGVVSGPYRPGASNPGAMREEVGGGAFNALRNACRVGAQGAMLSVRGGDAAGQMVEHAIIAAGISDISATFLDRSTPSYTAILEETGELVCGFADMALYEQAFDKQLRRHPFRDAISGTDGILTDANLPQPALERLAGSIRALPLFAIGVSPAKIQRLEPILKSLSMLFMNRNEACALSGLGAGAPDETLGRALSEKGLARAVITAGSGGLLLLDAGRLAKLTPPEVRNVRDVTGAGDALAGVTLARMLQGLDFHQAVRHGIAAASLTIESETVVADFDEAELLKRLADVPEVIGA